MKFSLKWLGVISFTCISALLIFVIILGARQIQLSDRYNAIITQSEKMIFQFLTIKEEITMALIGNKWQQIGHTAMELKELNSSLSRIQENNLIPSEYRLDLVKNADIAAIVLLAKELSASKSSPEISLQLQDKMRSLADYLIRFDRIIVSHMREKVIRFQLVMIGTLAMIICIISFSLTLFYKKTMLPIFRLNKQVSKTDLLQSGLPTDGKSCLELQDFIYAINEVLTTARKNQDGFQNLLEFDEEVGKLLNENTNLANGIINYAQLLADTYREVDMGKEERQILQSIIDDAERIGKISERENG